MPGFAWTWVFYAKGEAEALERIAYSFALSIALLSVAFFFCNRLLGIDINTLNSALIIAAVTALPPLHVLLKRKGIYEGLKPRRRSGEGTSADS